MKSMPILFRGDMVRAYIAGQKFQTRRIIKTQPPAKWDSVEAISTESGGVISWDFFSKKDRYDHGYIKQNCPYGRPGEALWVKETWRIGAWDHDKAAIAVDYKADNFVREEWLTVQDDIDGEKFNRYWEQSTNEAIKAGSKADPYGNFHWPKGSSPCKWRPSISCRAGFHGLPWRYRISASSDCKI